MNPDSPSISIIDDDDSVLRSLARLMGIAGYRTRTFSSAEEFLGSAPSPSEIGCLILDLRIPGLNGLELQRKLAANPVSHPIIFISGSGDTHSIVEAMKQGAVTFLEKPFDYDELLQAVSEALENYRRTVRERVGTVAIQLRIATLTARERDVMSHVINGELNKQIASALGIAEKTVKIHRGRSMHKMGVSSVAELVRLCDRVRFEVAPR